MCNLFVLRTSCREFFVPFLYLNNSESNVPKHLQCRAFTLIPLKKEASQSFTWPCYHTHVHTKKGLGSVKATCIYVYFSRFALHDTRHTSKCLYTAGDHFVFPGVGIVSFSRCRILAQCRGPAFLWSPALTYFIAYITPFPLCLLNMQCAVILSTLQDDRDAVYHIETIFSLETVAQLHEAAGMCGQVDSWTIASWT